MSEKLKRLKQERNRLQDKWLAASRRLKSNPNSFPLRQLVESLRRKVELNANEIIIEEGNISRRKKN